MSTRCRACGPGWGSELPWGRVEASSIAAWASDPFAAGLEQPVWDSCGSEALMSQRRTAR